MFTPFYGKKKQQFVLGRSKSCCHHALVLSGLPKVIKSYKKGCIILSHDKFKAFIRPKIGASVFYSQITSFQFSTLVFCYELWFTKEDNEETESSAEENVQYATS